MTYTQEDLKKDIASGKKVLPLQTINSLMIRWNLGHGAVFNRSIREHDFPKPISGMIEGVSHNKRLWPLYKIEEYEQRKGLGK